MVTLSGIRTQGECLVFGTQALSVCLLNSEGEVDSDTLVGNFIYVYIRSEGDVEKFVQVDTTTRNQVEVLSMEDEVSIDQTLNLIIVDSENGAKYSNSFNNFMVTVDVQEKDNDVVVGDEFKAVVMGTPLSPKSIFELAGGKLVEGQTIREALGFIPPADGTPFVGTWARFDGVST
uniref:Uncharacterized protein n=1 Tax=Chromera velia CCMP2878 TaxID=1169474 RepID=A0A0G4H807_9ALVE|eukprot:Cvel_25078.t1-p1 / transcript=Cvel_25078.t1 / gene=Cvel_25078 / organism=Chromera_velia_CCMP2878 / gene_product=hypothetical protein / transcript_product=hypothetical protein / location=Cvel_scaffold2792:11888-12902(+) / protein_length=175 / sequence_SO=supercontig / SO=protein_coding / is_pseudo=false